MFALLGLNWRFRLSIALVILGIALLAGTFPDIPGATGLLAIAGGFGVFVFAIVESSRSAGVERPAQKWELVADNARLLASQERWAEAVPEFHRAMSMTSIDARRMRAADEIGGYLAGRNREMDAEPFLRETLRLREQTYGPAHALTLASRELLGDTYMRLGDFDSAVRVRRRQLEVLAPSGTISTLDTAYAAAKLGEALQRHGDVAGAQAAGRSATAAIEAADPTTPQLGRALVAVSRLAFGAGDFQTAESLLNRAIESAARIGSAEELDLAQSKLLEVYVAAGRYADALPLSEKALDAVRKGAAGDPKRTARIYREHASVLERVGQPEAAAKHRRTADILERIGGGPDPA